MGFWAVMCPDSFVDFINCVFAYLNFFLICFLTLLLPYLCASCGSGTVTKWVSVKVSGKFMKRRNQNRLSLFLTKRGFSSLDSFYVAVYFLRQEIGW